MVNNNTGGNKAKGFARKHEKPVQSNRIRMVEDPDEKYAIVRKIFGGSICEVYCDDQTTRQAIIRGKFRGKGKRNNIITSGTVVLIGIRSWATETKTSKQEQADILEVYSQLELEQLKQKPNFPIDFLESSMRELFGNSSAGEKNDHFEFSLIEKETIETTTQIPIVEIDNDIINIDDI
jgi:initiation factor 1A